MPAKLGGLRLITKEEITKMKEFFEIMMGTDFTDLPEDVVSHTKHCILDAVGSALYGRLTGTGKSIVRGDVHSRDSKVATIIGSVNKVSTLDAYRVNARLSNMADFGEGDFNIPNHPGRMLVHSGLVAGEKLDATIAATITAIVACFETILRVGYAICPTIWPINQPYPNVAMSPCFTLPGLASIVRRFMGEELSDRTENITTTLVFEMLSLLENALYRDKTNSLIDDLLLEKISGAIDPIKLSRNLGSQYLAMKVGLRPNILDHFTKPPMIALKNTFRWTRIPAENVDLTIFKGAQWLESPEEEQMHEAKLRMACAILLHLSRIKPELSWYLNSQWENPVIREFSRKIMFVYNWDDWEEWMHSKYYPCMVQVITKRDIVRTMKIRYEVREIQPVGTEEEFKRIFNSNTAYFLGEKQSVELRNEILNSVSVKIPELMGKTYLKYRLKKGLV